VLSSERSGFLHHKIKKKHTTKNKQKTNKQTNNLISLIIGSSEGGFRSRDEESGQKKCEI
jgi:hypothetical protein